MIECPNCYARFEEPDQHPMQKCPWCKEFFWWEDFEIDESGPTQLTPDAEQQQATGEQETGAGEASR